MTTIAPTVEFGPAPEPDPVFTSASTEPPTTPAPCPTPGTEAVLPLLALHSGPQRPIRFLPKTWQRLLAAWPDARDIVTDDRYSTPREELLRTVDRAQLRALVADSDLLVDRDVLRAFTLITIWGTGICGRTYRNLPLALGERDAPHAPRCAAQLRAAALHCRAGELETAYKGLVLPGIGPSFFTKWFAFAGVPVASGPRPLILDARVLSTLHDTLGIRLGQPGRQDSAAHRYRAYVELLHSWSAELTAAGTEVDPERLEYVLYAHNGKPLPGKENTERRTDRTG